MHWLYETESIITMLLGLWMVNVVFSLGHRLLNFQSARVTYFVNASLFIYLVHHPLTLLFGAWITPHIQSNLLGFITGLVFVVGVAVLLYEMHLRIPLLRFLFSGKPQEKKCTTAGHNTITGRLLWSSKQPRNPPTRPDGQIAAYQRVGSSPSWVSKR